MQTMTCYRDFKNIVVKGSPLYQRSVVEQLDKVWGTWTGWAVLRSIIDSGRATRTTVTIVPYSATDRREKGPRNSYAAASARASTARGAPIYLGRSDDPSTPEDERFRAIPLIRGTGKGSDCELHYSPEVFQAPLSCSYRESPTGPCLYPVYAQNHGPDHTLVHELVHALREMRGQMVRIPTRTEGYTNQEEFFAILLQNTYASEKGMTILRRYHRGGWHALRDSLASSEGFLGKGQRPLSMEQLENRQLVKRFQSECFALCQNIGTRVSARFNPIGEYLRNPTLYPYDPRLAWGAPA